MIALPNLSTPNAEAEALTSRPYLSWSALSTYRSCPLKWHFKYVEGIREETVGANLVFGAALHAAIQTHYEALLSGDPPPALGELMAAYRNSWAERPEDRVLFGKEDIDNLEKMAVRMLRVFRGHPIASAAGAILGVEEELVGAAVPDCPDRLARLDLLTQTDVEVIVTDFKSSRSRWSQSDARDHAEQLLLYGELVRTLVPGKEVRLQFAVLTKAKAPALDVITVLADQQQIERTQRLAQRLWAAMQAGHVYPSRSPLNCPTCPFQRQCRAWGN